MVVPNEPSMEAREALAVFLTAVLDRDRADRFVGLAGKTKTHEKFLSELNAYHRFYALINRDTVVASLPELIWKREGFSFSREHGFGVAEPSLKSRHESPDDGILVITADATYGYFRPGGRADAEILFRTK